MMRLQQSQNQFKPNRMEDTQVEYLDYRKPVRDQQQAPLSVPKVIEEFAELLLKYNKPREQKRQQKKPPYKFSLLIELDNYRIEAAVGQYEECEADVIVLPYYTSELQCFPCKQLSEEEVKSDKEKIKALASKTGELYLKAKRLQKYKYRAFIKVEPHSATKDILYGINSLIKLATQKKIPISTVAVIFTSQVFELQQLFQSLLRLQTSKESRAFTLKLILPSRKWLSELYGWLE